MLSRNYHHRLKLDATLMPQLIVSTLSGLCLQRSILLLRHAWREVRVGQPLGHFAQSSTHKLRRFIGVAL
jgi:hypothetical protein